MMKRLHDYRYIVGDKVISDIYRHARKLYGKRIIHLNSTYSGGGVAEMLHNLAPLMNDAGVETDWRILRGTVDFFDVTKSFHNSLQSDDIELTDHIKNIYISTNEEYSVYAKIDHDCVFIHDPQPLPLIQFYAKRQPWVWRCHIDLSNPNPGLWDFLKGFILRYDYVIVSRDTYKKEDLPIEHKLFAPVIDPLSSKNIDLSQEEIDGVFKKFNIPTDKPLITQISRFDKWKDPLGVLEIYKKVRKQVDCRLVLCGSMASDDPEGLEIYETVKERAHEYLENGDVMLITLESNLLVNALQRQSKVIIQKSIREGFGLTVTEALWKGTPVVASNVGGIPIQVKDGETGFLVEPHDHDTTTDIIADLLKKPDKGRKIGERGREYVRDNFLITRLVIDYLELLKEILE